MRSHCPKSTETKFEMNSRLYSNLLLPCGPTQLSQSKNGPAHDRAHDPHNQNNSCIWTQATRTEAPHLSNQLTITRITYTKSRNGHANDTAYDSFTTRTNLGFGHAPHNPNRPTSKQINLRKPQPRTQPETTPRALPCTYPADITTHITTHITAHKTTHITCTEPRT